MIPRFGHASLIDWLRALVLVRAYWQTVRVSQTVNASQTMSASQMAAEIFKAALCPRGVCRETALDRFDPPEIRTAAR